MRKLVVLLLLVPVLLVTCTPLGAEPPRSVPGASPEAAQVVVPGGPSKTKEFMGLGDWLKRKRGEEAPTEGIRMPNLFGPVNFGELPKIPSPMDFLGVEKMQESMFGDVMLMFKKFKPKELIEKSVETAKENMMKDMKKMMKKIRQFGDELSQNDSVSSNGQVGRLDLLGGTGGPAGGLSNGQVGRPDLLGGTGGAAGSLASLAIPTADSRTGPPGDVVIDTLRAISEINTSEVAAMFDDIKTEFCKLFSGVFSPGNNGEGTPCGVKKPVTTLPPPATEVEYSDTEEPEEDTTVQELTTKTTKSTRSTKSRANKRVETSKLKTTAVGSTKVTETSPEVTTQAITKVTETSPEVTTQAGTSTKVTTSQMTSQVTIAKTISLVKIIKQAPQSELSKTATSQSSSDAPPSTELVLPSTGPELPSTGLPAAETKAHAVTSQESPAPADATMSHDP